MAGLVTTRPCSFWAFAFIAFIFVLESVASLRSRTEGGGLFSVSAEVGVWPAEAFNQGLEAVQPEDPAPLAVAGMRFLSSPEKSPWPIACPIFSFSLPRKADISCEAFTCPDCILSSDSGWIALFEPNPAFSSHGFHSLADKVKSKLDTKKSFRQKDFNINHLR
jgi:hypothetical protein